MSAILQDRDETELRLIVERFLQAMKFQHQFNLPYSDLAPVAAECMKVKINDMLSSWLMGFSIPELMKIINFVQEDQAKVSKKDNKKSSNKTALQ